MIEFGLLSALLVGLLLVLIYKLVYFYTKTIHEYPPGPTPHPLLGNIFHYLKYIRKKHPHKIIREVGKDYRPVFTFWLGHLPHVIVLDPQAVLEALKSKSFSGRPHIGVVNGLISKEGSTTVGAHDPSPVWDVSRKVSASAVRKTAMSLVLPESQDFKPERFIDSNDNIIVGKGSQG